jgi:hypothetical protein
MARFEVTTDLIVHCKVKVVVEADTKDGAIDAVADLLPNNFDPDRAKAWKATVKLKPPTGVEVTGCKAYHFEQASGSDKARKIG